MLIKSRPIHFGSSRRTATNFSHNSLSAAMLDIKLYGLCPVSRPDVRITLILSPSTRTISNHTWGTLISPFNCCILLNTCASASQRMHTASDICHQLDLISILHSVTHSHSVIRTSIRFSCNSSPSFHIKSITKCELALVHRNAHCH